jgi:predicted N-formylglutamate amidohydrolase
VLGKREQPAFSCVNGRLRSPLVIVCDHASNAVPRSLKRLGLGTKTLRQHIAWDPGTADIGRYLSRNLRAPLVLANYSRLVVDLNRGEEHPDCMRDVSDHVSIPGNRRLSRQHKTMRLDEIYWPYHTEITRRLDAVLARGEVPLLLSLHSFTPQMDGQHRPWHIGVMWNRQRQLSRRLVAQLRRDNPALVIGENEPYSLQGDAGGKNTIERHAESRGLPYLIVEFRQDLVSDRASAEQWAALFLRSLLPIVTDAKTYRRQPVKAAIKSRPQAALRVRTKKTTKKAQGALPRRKSAR